jgi:hypothetical protein
VDELGSKGAATLTEAQQKVEDRRERAVATAQAEARAAAEHAADLEAQLAAAHAAAADKAMEYTGMVQRLEAAASAAADEHEAAILQAREQAAGFDIFEDLRIFLRDKLQQKNTQNTRMSIYIRCGRQFQIFCIRC